jgi:hypothetical protein
VRLQHAPGFDQGGQVVWGWVGLAQQIFTVGTLGRGPVVGGFMSAGFPFAGYKPRVGSHGRGINRV